MSLEELIRSGMSRIGVVRVRSALNPFLWSLAWSLVFLSFAVALKDDKVAEYILVALAAIPMVVSMGIGCFFAFTDPDRLQSEEYVLKQSELSIIARKGAPPLLSGPETAEDIPALEDKKATLEIPAFEEKKTALSGEE